MSPLAVIKAGALTFSGYCTASGTWFVFLLTYLFTPCSKFLLQQLTVSQLVKFPAFYGTRSFMTAFTKARSLSLS
jgi:hypothetical protein